MEKHLFLFGGGAPFTDRLATIFANKARDVEGPVAFLFVERDGWQAYMPNYTEKLAKNGVTQFEMLPLPSAPVEEVVGKLKGCAGIVICGGDTNRYADYIVDTAIGGSINAAYRNGVPVAGFSAGVLISPEHCVISPKDNPRQQYEQRRGLGLIDNVVIAVHYSQWGDEAHLQEARARNQGCDAIGIDEESGVYCHNGIIALADGAGVYQIKDGWLINLLQA